MRAVMCLLWVLATAPDSGGRPSESFVKPSVRPYGFVGTGASGTVGESLYGAGIGAYLGAGIVIANQFVLAARGYVASAVVTLMFAAGLHLEGFVGQRWLVGVGVTGGVTFGSFVGAARGWTMLVPFRATYSFADGDTEHSAQRGFVVFFEVAPGGGYEVLNLTDRRRPVRDEAIVVGTVGGGYSWW